MQNWLKVFFLLFMFGLLVFFNSLNNKFLIDDYSFLNNPVNSGTKFILSQWDPYRERAMGVMDSRANLGYYRPLTHILYDCCYAVFKNNFWQYHLLNLFLFVFASSLIYLLVEKVTGNYNLAFLTGLIYLIHPINGIIVNYISANVFAFQVICTLSTILLLWESLERKSDRILYILSLVFSFLSLLWHESGIMVPFYVCVFILIFRKEPFKSKALYLFPYFLIIFFYFVFRSVFIKNGGNILEHMILIHLTGWEYLAALFQVYAWYISKLLFPYGIVMQWATPILHDHLMINVLGLCLMLMIFLLLFVRFAKEKVCRLAIAWILIGFVPVCLAAFIRPDIGALIEPHWFVFSSIGFFILAAYFLLLVLNRMKIIGPVLLFIIILAWGSVSHAYNQLWADQKTYSLYWSRQVPYLKWTYCYLAEAYQREGALNESRKYYRMALSGHPSDDIDIFNNLGIIAAQEGDWKRAELNFKRVLEINSSFASAYNNLGIIYFNQGQWDKSKEYFNRSLMLDPLSLEPRRNLASIFIKQSEYQKAINLCLKNLDIVNDDPRTLLLLIDIYNRKKDLVNLKEYAHRILSLETDPQALTRLGGLMAQNNAFDLALDCFTKAMRVDPDYKDAYLATGTLFANLGQYDEAIHIWKLGSSINPSDNRFKNSITKAEGLKSRNAYVK